MPTFGGATGHSAIDLLADATMGKMVKDLSEKYYSMFELLSVFGYQTPRIISTDRFMFTTLVDLLKISDGFDAGPQTGERMDLTRLESAILGVLYKAYQFDVDTNDEALLRAQLSDLSTREQDDRMVAETTLINQIEKLTEAFYRLHNKLCAAILTGQTDLSSLKVKGVDGVLNFGITTKSESSTPWSNPATDIQGRFTALLREFRERNGGRNPTHMITNSRFHELYIMTNAELRANFAPFNPGLMQTILGPLLKNSEANLGVSLKHIRVDDMIDPVGNGTYSDLTVVWPDKYLTLIRSVPGEEAFKSITSRNKDNFFRGGLASYYYETKNPMRTVGVIGGNFMPVIQKPTCAMAINVTGA